MQKHTIAIALVALLIGLGVGYGVAAKKVPVQQPANQNIQGGHMMHMSMNDMMLSMNAELKGKTGNAFDQAFLAEMIVHHEGAVDMAELALTNAKHQEIKDLASAIIAAQNKEIAEMKAWQMSWYNQ